MRFLALVSAIFLTLSGAALAESAKPHANAAKVTFANEMKDGKKTWLPADAKIPAGKVEITLVNTLTEPHGFTAPGLTDDIVVGAKETKVVTVDAAKAGSYKFHCQLHPAHVGGSIVVQ